MNRESDLQTGTIHANGLNFSFLEIGQGPLVLALHGFPDTPRTFRHQMRALAEAGYRVVAPYMRGYAPTDAPERTTYHNSVLVQDTVALLEALTSGPATLIGHDWGAGAAYGATIIAPEKVSRLITLAVPHGGAWRVAFLTNRRQQRRSWYAYFFLVPFAEAAVAVNDFAFLEQLWRDWSPNWDYLQEEIEAVKQIFRHPASLSAALNYYRHNLSPCAPPSPYPQIDEQLGNAIPVPALYIHGEQDGCIGVECTEGMEESFLAGLQKHVLPGAGHFVHAEKPEAVTRLILDFIENRSSVRA